MSYYKKGEYNVVCDRCQHEVKSGKTLLEWQGYRVCRECYEAKHPQDYKSPVPVDNYTITGNQVRVEPSLVFDSDTEYWEDQEQLWNLDFRNWEDV